LNVKYNYKQIAINKFTNLYNNPPITTSINIIAKIIKYIPIFFNNSLLGYKGTINTTLPPNNNAIKNIFNFEGHQKNIVV